ncbi:hypothetical protein BD626DRAFT_513367 [Schizophyllum amplum]|uniref:Uncharacterized protein n=1 Tax=Schizophyllum amplum TaxID=97359 RepID=A0A550BZF2_9AGAR|nr:hypothetical protein BD626DRAFT_513367 [Auriculariopsis ampla]
MEKTPSCISQSLFLAMTDPGWNEDTQPPQTILPRLKSFYHKGATKYAFQEAEMRDIVHRLCQSRSNPPLLFTVDCVGTLK